MTAKLAWIPLVVLPLLDVSTTGCGASVSTRPSSASGDTDPGSDCGGGPPDAGGPDSGSTGAPGQTLGPNSVSLDLAARLQWEANFGYCGEISLGNAGLYFGQYLSQYDARALASPGVSQSSDASQLLLDANEGTAATAMKLSYEIWPKNGTPNDFLLWTKNHLLANHPVVIGIFENTAIFGFTAQAGDDYDHIVPVMGYSSSHPIADQQVYSDDQLTFSDNGDYDQSVQTSPLIFSYAISSFVFDRAHQPNQPYYLNNGEDSAIAILGIADPNGETLRVQLKTDKTSEQPEMVDGSSKRPAAGPVTLTITVYGLIPGVAYTLYKYTSFSAVPTSDFNSHAAQAATATPVTVTSGSTFTTQETIMSNEMAIYRAVKASNP
jgi:hypothetical protein